MKRRKFLIIAGLSGAAAALTSARFLTTSFEQSAEALIKRELSFLRLDEDGLKKFVADYSASKDRTYKRMVKGYGLIGLGTAQSGKIHQLVSQYLLSTDFFHNKMDESRIVKYIALYNPYTSPCAHPFSAAQYLEEKS